jgi:hypothetical protein
MVTKKTSEKVATKSRVKVAKLQLNKETIKDLTPGKQTQVNQNHCDGNNKI